MESLVNYYQTNSIIAESGHFSLTELENMIPFERYIYINLMINRLNEKGQQDGSEASDNW